MNPAFMVLANRSLSFHLYDFYYDGITVKELAASHSMPIHMVEEQIEAVRLCLKFQATITLKAEAQAERPSRRQSQNQAVASGSKHLTCRKPFFGGLEELNVQISVAG